MTVPLIVATVAWPAVLVVVAIVVAACLWGLFRRGSVADRARHDATTPDGAGDVGDGGP
jgi:hypothetical protein